MTAVTSSLPWSEQPSVCAQRLQSFRKQYEQLMQVCDRRDDERLFELFFRMGVEARSILDYSTLDLDLMAFLSVEKAAGRTYSSQALAKQVFSQAGVVAPPESLKSETFAFLG